jgi:hypothetical protein
MTPSEDRRDTGESRNAVARSAEMPYNGNRKLRNVDGVESEPARRSDGLTVIVPSEPPAIDPQVGRLLLRILLTARDQQGSSTDERRAA